MMEATKRIPALRLIGIILLLWAYGMNVHGVIGEWQEAHQSPEAAAQAHLEAMQRHPEMEMHASPRPGLSTPGIVLFGLLLLAGAALAVFPVRWGAWYGVWATAVVWVGIAAPRIASDRRCWQVLDPNKHGCHTFMLSVAIGVAGLVLCAVSQRNKPVVGG